MTPYLGMLGRISTPATEAPSSVPRAAQSVTVRLRWFGLLVGFAIVNLKDESANQLTLNAILGLGTLYAALDTLAYLQRWVFLGAWPLFTSAMEAVFIGMLCYFDAGVTSIFHFYYVLSLLVCAIRYPPYTTYITCGMHIVSCLCLTFLTAGVNANTLAVTMLTPVVLGWVTWACVSFAGIMKLAGEELTKLNAELKLNQALLEDRIARRTRELQESQALLVQQEKQAAFGLLAAGIAHEVGNPLAAISSLVQLLNRRALDQYTTERLQMVDDQLLRIQRTLRELVDFSRPASKDAMLCDVHAAVDAALSIAKYYKRRKGKRISTSYAEGVPPFRIVRDQLVQVFLNLILNAMDATEEAGTIDISSSFEDGWLTIEIRDNGSGIAVDDRDRIFQPYFTTKATGTGLGLFVCRRIIEDLGGRMELRDSTPQGTTFAVLLRHVEPFTPPREEEFAPAGPLEASPSE
ncbi:MAG: two-component sensor histidine kinase [Planctomycetaceae bacterium]|nr:two-component sensor histidine kinase [Planctomycetaceae bacterium]